MSANCINLASSKRTSFATMDTNVRRKTATTHTANRWAQNTLIQHYMKKYLTFLFILISLFTNISAQFFFIPIIIPTNQQYYNCPSKDDLAMDYFQKGLDIYSTNKQLANIYFKGAIKRDSFFCDAYYVLVNSFRSTKDYDSAMKYIDLTLKNNKIDLWAMKIRGILLLNKKDYNLAETYFKDLYDLQPREATWLYYYVQSLIKLNKLDSAWSLTMQMEMLMMQEEGWDSKSLSYYMQGQIAFQRMNYKTAFRAFNEIKSVYRQNSEFCYLYGMTLMRKENPNMNKAKRFIKRAVKLGYGDVETKIREELKI
jgi:tetratricopeptide (TPR) repeat protein